jgi:hypothetical protein
LILPWWWILDVRSDRLMQPVRQHPLFYTVILALLLLLAAGLVMLIAVRQSLGVIMSDFELRQRQYQSLSESRIAPTSENAREVIADLEQNSQILVQMLDTLNASGSDDLLLFQGVPKSRTDAYFNLATFVERSRQLAEQAGVEVGAEERFGFGAYANEGPDAEFIEAIFKQRRIAEVLLEALFSAKPERLIGVFRDDWELARDEPGGVRPVTRAGNNKVGETFVIDPQVTARVPDVVRTYAFRLEFVGQTASLRTFMNRVAGSDLPLVVRSVDVESHAPPERRTRGRQREDPFAAIADQASSLDLPALQAARVPIVHRNLARFAVTVEFLEIRIEPPKPAGGEAS